MYELLTLLPTVLVVQLLVVHVVRCGTAVSRIKRKMLHRRYKAVLKQINRTIDISLDSRAHDYPVSLKCDEILLYELKAATGIGKRILLSDLSSHTTGPATQGRLYHALPLRGSATK